MIDLNINTITEECIQLAAQRFTLPPILIKAVLLVEGGKIGQTHSNKNGSYDIGPMQINSIWLPKFSKYVSYKEILHNGCTNVQVGAWILRYNINQSGDFWSGVGNYHSATLKKHIAYQQRVYKAAQYIKYKSRKKVGK